MKSRTPVEKVLFVRSKLYFISNPKFANSVSEVDLLTSALAAYDSLIVHIFYDLHLEVYEEINKFSQKSMFHVREKEGKLP